MMETWMDTSPEKIYERLVKQSEKCKQNTMTYHCNPPGIPQIKKIRPEGW